MTRSHPFAHGLQRCIYPSRKRTGFFRSLSSAGSLHRGPGNRLDSRRKRAYPLVEVLDETCNKLTNFLNRERRHDA